MTIAIAAPTGKVAGSLAARLVERGADVALLVRDPAKVKALTDRGARAHAGSLDDGDFVEGATRGAEALFWLLPPNPVVDDYLAWQRRLIDIAVRAVERNRIGRVVTLSSVGGHREEGTGPIATLFHLERRLDATSARTTHLRAGYFFENHFMSLATIGELGKIFLPVAPETELPMVATADIAAAAERALVDASLAERRVIGVHGPEDLTFAGAAAALSEGLGREVEHVQVPPGAARDSLLGFGLKPAMVELYLEMYASFGRFQPYAEEPRDPELGGATRLVDFARQVLAPALAS